MNYRQVDWPPGPSTVPITSTVTPSGLAAGTSQWSIRNRHRSAVLQRSFDWAWSRALIFREAFEWVKWLAPVGFGVFAEVAGLWSCASV